MRNDVPPQRIWNSHIIFTFFMTVLVKFQIEIRFIIDFHGNWKLSMTSCPPSSGSIIMGHSGSHQCWKGGGSTALHTRNLESGSAHLSPALTAVVFNNLLVCRIYQSLHFALRFCLDEPSSNQRIILKTNPTIRFACCPIFYNDGPIILCTLLSSVVYRYYIIYVKGNIGAPVMVYNCRLRLQNYSDQLFFQENHNSLKPFLFFIRLSKHVKNNQIIPFHLFIELKIKFGTLLYYNQ